MTTTWVAAFRSAVISPYERISYVRSRAFADQTVRQILHLDGGGEALRVRFSNRYGVRPLTVAAARVALRKSGSEIVAETDTGLRFGGAAETTIPVGGQVVSDPVGLAVGAGADLAVSLYLPEETGPATFSHQPQESAYVTRGDAVSDVALPGAEEVASRFYITGVDVRVPEGAAVAVAFGDSWFDGVGTTPGANRRSPNLLNRRLARGWVVNQGIAGNRLLTDEIGEHALARFERDVLQVPGVSHVLVHFGINDLGLPGIAGLPPATADDLVAGFTELARRSHEAGLRILAATIGPFAGSIYPGVDTPEGQRTRRVVNEWIRTGGVFDAVFDVAAAVQDPDRPDFIRPDLDSGDHTHLNDAGAQAMADSVDPATVRL
ncbi:SGNH/GDSL hydrolase family protein [Streptosporangium carneum]|uniref:SGNH hydrolase n=1 Tax=Streptosporangium carneum TaxID=47481 RepID=A0A9W6MDK6_9ACTN|nr:SGNH/GDSL hydrolase family protein [Streptosporangium carneum]GLK10599.1 SGNH hydrolase [Streptosporangium carneum]